MPEKRRKFSPQFKAEAVQMVIETGKPVAEVARDLGVNDGTLGNWAVSIGRRNTSMTEVCGGEFEEAVAGATCWCAAAVGCGSGTAPRDAVAGSA
jgi:transposase-like protein